VPGWWDKVTSLWTDYGRNMSLIGNWLWTFTLFPGIVFVGMWLQHTVLPNSTIPSSKELIDMQSSLMRLIESAHANSTIPILLETQLEFLAQTISARFSRWIEFERTIPIGVIPSFFFSLGINPLVVMALLFAVASPIFRPENDHKPLMEIIVRNVAAMVFFILFINHICIPLYIWNNS